MNSFVQSCDAAQWRRCVDAYSAVFAKFAAKKKEKTAEQLLADDEWWVIIAHPMRYVCCFPQDAARASRVFGSAEATKREFGGTRAPHAVEAGGNYAAAN
jgi:hypothetical protein